MTGSEWWQFVGTFLVCHPEFPQEICAFGVKGATRKQIVGTARVVPCPAEV